MRERERVRCNFCPALVDKSRFVYFRNFFGRPMLLGLKEKVVIQSERKPQNLHILFEFINII